MQNRGAAEKNLQRLRKVEEIQSSKGCEISLIEAFKQLLCHQLNESDGQPFRRFDRHELP